MRSMPGLMRPLLALTAALTVTGCSATAGGRQTFPLAADLAVPPKPQRTIEVLTSAQASADFHNALEAWADGLAAQIGGLCRYHQRKGMPIVCPPASDD